MSVSFFCSVTSVFVTWESCSFFGSFSSSSTNMQTATISSTNPMLRHPQPLNTRLPHSFNLLMSMFLSFDSNGFLHNNGRIAFLLRKPIYRYWKCFYSELHSRLSLNMLHVFLKCTQMFCHTHALLIVTHGESAEFSRKFSAFSMPQHQEAYPFIHISKLLLTESVLSIDTTDGLLLLQVIF